MIPIITRATQICDIFCERIHETTLREEDSLSTISLVIQEQDYYLIKILNKVLRFVDNDLLIVRISLHQTSFFAFIFVTSK